MHHAWSHPKHPMHLDLPCRRSKPKPHHPLWVRLLAVMAAITMQGQIKLAVPLFERSFEHGKPADYNRRCPSPYQFIQHNYKKFLKLGSVEDKPHPSHDKKVSDDVARQASFVLKAGYNAYQTKAQGVLDYSKPVHTHYTSVGHAYAQNALFRSLCDTAGVSPKHMLRRIHEVDDSLTSRYIDFKKELTADQMLRRQMVATTLLSNHNAHADYLKRIVWLDEAMIVFVPSHQFKIKVYCDKNDTEICVHVVHNPFEDASPKHKIKVRCLCAVNYHLGPFYLEWTTGTTDIVRIRNGRQGTYKVGAFRGAAPTQTAAAAHCCSSKGPQQQRATPSSSAQCHPAANGHRHSLAIGQ